MGDARHLSIDIETRSGVDIRKSGAYKYAQSPEFRILLIAWRWDNEEAGIADLASGEELPERERLALGDPLVVKHAYNAAFEWYCLNRAGYLTPLDQWRCTMAHGLYCGYTAGLEATGKAVGLPQEKRKLATGKALIRYFCAPCKPTRANGNRTWNQPWHDTKKWSLFKEYCVQDVVTERELLKRLELFPMPESEERQWRLDTLMNAYGVRADRELIRGALLVDGISRERLTSEAVAISGVDNPNSAARLMRWLSDNGTETPDLRKETVEELLRGRPEGAVRRMLELRQRLGKTSVRKYQAMEAAICEDGRIRGLTQYYGANRTGRWAGRLVQLQNLPRNYLKNLDYARELTKAGNHDGIQLLYGSVPDILSQLIRTAFIPSEGNHLLVADFAAIEARVIAWLAGERWVNEVFATHGKIYEATA